MESYKNIPQELRERRQWVAFTLVERDGKLTKLPINPKNGKLAKTDDSKTWGSFEQACKTATHLSGIGFVFSENGPYFGIDMDHHIDMDLVKWMDTYAERSFSGDGGHIIGKGMLPDHVGHKNASYEVYDDKRYFVFTGKVIYDKPIADCQEKLIKFTESIFGRPEEKSVNLSKFLQPLPGKDIIERIQESAQAEKFNALWRGDISDYEGDDSRADAALLEILRFWTGGDKRESFRLFEMSALLRPKWTNRRDYQEKTWAFVDHGEVYEEPINHFENLPVSIIKSNTSPWRKYTAKDVESAISGTLLGDMVKCLQAPMDPVLPFEIAFCKALSLFGCALSEKQENVGLIQESTCYGRNLANVVLNTSGGQVCNMWTMIIAQSGIGKDVGNMAEELSMKYNWLIGTGGSEEGLADAYCNRPNGLLSISEMKNWLTAGHWQNRATGFLTQAFNSGFFKIALSKRGKEPSLRESNYCYPNIFAAVQPGVMSAVANRVDLESGFLGRFIMAIAPTDYIGVPSCKSLDNEIATCAEILDIARCATGIISVKDGYSLPLLELFRDAKAEPVSSWKRLSNEYFPRLAYILSMETDHCDYISNDGYERAEIVVKWLFKNAEMMLSNIHSDIRQSQFETLISKLGSAIYGNNNEATLTILNHKTGRGTRSKDRKDALLEMQDRSWLIIKKAGKTSKYTLTEVGINALNLQI